MTLSLASMAASPKLASAKIFDDLDLYDPSLSITIVERKDQTVRSVMFKNNPELLKKIQKALTADKEKADKKSLMTDNGEISESVVINNEEAEIKIGLTTSKSNEVYFFLKIRPKHNRNGSKRTSSNTRNTKSKSSSKSKKSAKTQSQEDMKGFEEFEDFSEFNDFSNFAEFSFAAF